MDTANIAPALLLEIIRIQTDIVRQGLDLGSVMQMVCERAAGLCGADGAVVELAEGEDMVYRAAAGIAEGQLGLRLRRQGSLSGLSVAQNQILQCDDSETDARVDREACLRVGLRSMLVVPLQHASGPVGVLKVVARQAHAFKPGSAAVLGLLSELIGAAIYHALQMDADELYRRATHDALTGLANRALFYDRLRQQLAQAQRSGANVAILNIDMDGLKAINDQQGHRAGDAALRQVATRIATSLRQGDLAARLGGDEFAVILPDVGDRHGVASKCAALGLAIAAPFHFEGTDLSLSASIGHALSPEDGAEMEHLLELADQAMYRVKQARRQARL